MIHKLESHYCDMQRWFIHIRPYKLLWSEDESNEAISEILVEWNLTCNVLQKVKLSTLVKIKKS